METSVAKIHTNALPKELQSYIHEDFKANEAFYWKIRNGLLKTYSGKWVAIDGGKVISASKNIFDVTQKVGKEKRHAFITKVGEEDKIVLKRRRVQFNYDTDYPGFAMPQTRVSFSNFSESASTKFENVIPDTGSDGTGLPIADCEKIQLFESPYFAVFFQRCWSRRKGYAGLSRVCPNKWHEIPRANRTASAW